MEVVDQILDIITWYRGVPSDYTDINELMHSRKELATLSVTLATEAAKARSDWKRKESRYDLEKCTKRIRFENHGTTKADWYARVNTKAEQEAYIEAENKYYELDYFLRSIREVLSEINQRVAALRAEIENSKY